ncbi:uncharacterized protein LOC143238103 [Tachypleus tridentatus]|uniref:uncharacterized protein LOC143238103 n=1 Tax=Tachypleus tridentatus TaxID=6853 RepID=UPI003FD3104C
MLLRSYKCTMLLMFHMENFLPSMDGVTKDYRKMIIFSQSNYILTFYAIVATPLIPGRQKLRLDTNKVQLHRKNYSFIRLGQQDNSSRFTAGTAVSLRICNPAVKGLIPLGELSR